jgi:hypothetical protein
MPALSFGISAGALLTVIKGAILVVDGASVQRPFRHDWPVIAIDGSSADGAMRLAELYLWRLRGLRALADAKGDRFRVQPRRRRIEAMPNPSANGSEPKPAADSPISGSPTASPIARFHDYFSTRCERRSQPRAAPR